MSEKSRFNKPPKYSRRRFRPAPPAYSAQDEDRAGGSRSGDANEGLAQGPGDGRALLDAEGRIDLFLNLKDAPPAFTEENDISVEEPVSSQAEGIACPPMNIVIFIVGSRGDVQPYLALALRLITSHSHRVRIATHGNFKEFVLSANRFLKDKVGKRGKKLEGLLEFADVGGDPKALMSYMVKNPGLLPSLPSLFRGEVGKKRKMTAEMMRGFYRACFYPDPLNGDFAADAIISNPPAFAHVSIAEALGLPLLLTFTMPWTATSAYQHPLVNVRQSNAEKAFTNSMTYALADILIFQGLGDVVNSFRSSVLGLEPISDKLGPSLIDRLRIPWTYCWNDGLLPRPKDWKNHIDVSGFYFLENDTAFVPDDDLVAFLEAGPPPLYIGFGSVVIDDPEKATQTIFDAIGQAGVRAIVHSGWAGLGKGSEGTSPEIYVLSGDVPHDWLFADGRVAAVCHHGGAGTTAIGLREGVPTIIVPFFGDQPFWGYAVHHAGAGPSPIPFKELSVDRLASAITFAISPEAKEAAGLLGDRIRSEDSLQKGVDSFHRHMPISDMLCEIDPSRIAVWFSEELCLRLSAAVAGVLVEENLINIRKLRPHRSKHWDLTKHSLEPLSGAIKAVMNATSVLLTGTSQLFYRPIRGAANMTFYTVEATFAIISDMWQGFDNLPGLIGSPVREVGPVTGFGSGLREGTKGLGFGLWDGITGLVTEPIHGGFQEGVVGVGKGFARSYFNLAMRPTAGILAFFVHPWRGGYYSIRNAFKPEFSALGVMRGPRESASVREAAEVTPEERAEILEKWATIRKGTRKRRRKMKRRRNRVFLVDRKGKKVAVVNTDTGEISSPPPTGFTSPASTPGLSPTNSTWPSTRSSISTGQNPTYTSDLSAIEEELKSSYVAETHSTVASSPMSEPALVPDVELEISPVSPLSPTAMALIDALKGPSPFASKAFENGYPNGEPQDSISTTFGNAEAGPSSRPVRASASSRSSSKELPPLPPGAMAPTLPVHVPQDWDTVDDYRPEGEGWRGGPITPPSTPPDLGQRFFRFKYQQRRDDRRKERESSVSS